MADAVPIRNVDANGIGPSGEDYGLRGTPEAIEQGLIIERPILMRYPDGRLEAGIEAWFTTTGFERLKLSIQDIRAGLPVAPVGRRN